MNLIKMLKCAVHAINKRAIAYVPAYKPPDIKDVNKLRDFISQSKKILILSGAGISTESGIPDYRSEGVGLYTRSNHKPVTYQEFVKHPEVRQRYWARNFIGWPRFSSIQPNRTHYAITDLEKNGKVQAIVTQNVDRLHQKAGSDNVIELHGSGYTVKCLNCTYTVCRHELQEVLQQCNPNMKNRLMMIHPDGDVELPKEDVENFKAPTCPDCNSPLKPDIVFFGDNVPKERVDLIKNCVSCSDAIFVLGSSLSVYSSYRIILQAKEEGKTIGILNIGPTRADELACLKISTKCSDILCEL